MVLSALRDLYDLGLGMRVLLSNLETGSRESSEERKQRWSLRVPPLFTWRSTTKIMQFPISFVRPLSTSLPLRPRQMNLQVKAIVRPDLYGETVVDKMTGNETTVLDAVMAVLHEEHGQEKVYVDICKAI